MKVSLRNCILIESANKCANNIRTESGDVPEGKKVSHKLNTVSLYIRPENYMKLTVLNTFGSWRAK